MNYLTLPRLLVRFKLCTTSKTIFRGVHKDAIPVDRIRNIGIIAHIDAGKTTTTERMLYYSGFTSYMGEVDKGDTVTDYMPQERERGITITSAAVTFNWKKHKINLIDTPGHVDFTIEVERSLCVLDGGVTILDASAGVEVQTLTVWKQATRHKVPCIVYLNKMDKPTADVDMCLKSIEEKLKVKPLLLQVPVGIGRSFQGVIDILSMEKFLWSSSEGRRDNHKYLREKIDPVKNSDEWIRANKQRNEIIETIVDFDDILADKFLSGGISAITDADLTDALKRVTMKRTALPVFCGSSYKNIAVQLLMDAVLIYLPAPNERVRDFVKYFGGDMCCQVFKIIHDKIRGPLTFLRIYSGSIENGQRIFNVNRNITEKVGKLMVASADNFHEVSAMSCGNIAVVSGLKNSVTNDLIMSSSSAATKVKAAFSETNSDYKGLMPGEVQIPDPVFFCTIEPPSLGMKNQLDHALQCLQREDPTLVVEVDDELGQTILSGMGELHIDIIKERIRNDYGVEADLGPLQIAYRETAVNKCINSHILDKTLAGTKHYVKITLGVLPCPGGGKVKNIKVIVTADNDLGKIRSDYLKAVNNGILNSLNCGPVIGFPVIDVSVQLLWLEVGKGTSPLMIAGCAAQCVRNVLQKCSAELLEPVMRLVITVKKGCAGRVISDLSVRRSQILNIEPHYDVEVIYARTPLSELRGYSSALRAMTSGMCSFTMDLDSYDQMNSMDKAKVVESMTGYGLQ